MKTMQSIFQAPRALALAFALSLGGYGTVIASDGNPVFRGSWPGFSRGAITVAVSGEYAYASGDVGLDVFDLSQPSSPQRVGRCDIDGCNFEPYSTWAANLALSGHFAYLARGCRLDVIDIANPVQPARVGGYQAPYGGLECVAVSGNYAYVLGGRWDGTNWIRGLQVFGVSSPANPQSMGWCPIRRQGRDLVVSGNYAYVAENEQDVVGNWKGGLEVMDISSPATPKPVGWYDAGDAALTWVQKVAVSGNYAYLGGANGLQVIDISNPADPQLAGEIDTGAVGSLALSGKYAYVGTMEWNVSALKVIDISNPARPQWVGVSDSLGIGRGFMSAAVSSHYACVGVVDVGLQVIDISNPASPELLGVIETMGQTRNVALSGNYAYLAEGYAGLRVIDVSNAGSPRKVGEYHTSAAAETVAVSGKYACVGELEYAGGWVSRLEVVDISNPAEPKHVGWYDPGDAVWKPAVSGNYAYLPGPGGLQVIDVSNPADPQRVGGYADAKDLTGFVWNQSVAVVSNRAYVANGADGLLVLDVSNPTNITKVGGYRTVAQVWKIGVSGYYACLAGAYDLHVIDISNPTNPLLVGRYGLPEEGGWYIYTMAVAGNYVYLNLNVCGPGAVCRLEVIDISNPSHPERVGSGPYFADGVFGVAGSGNHIYLAGVTEGLLILEMQPFIKSIAMQSQDLKLSWEGFGLARLQRATRLTNPDWNDVPGSEATNNIILPIEGASAFFRLAKP
jgi:hypothetical protein